jgi:flagellin
MASFGDYNRVNTNVTAMDARLSLNKINKDLGESRLKLSTGFKINNAEDDAAGFAIATKLKSRVAGLEQGLQNVSDAKSVLDVAEGAYSTVIDNLIEMKSLATQAANGTIAAGSDEMKYIASQLEALAKDINDVSKSTTYNGIDLMDSAQSLTFQVGEGNTDTMDVTLNKVNMASLFNTAGTDASLSSTEVLGATTGGGSADDYTYDGSAPTTGQTGHHLFNAIDTDLADTGQAAVNYGNSDDVLADDLSGLDTSAGQSDGITVDATGFTPAGTNAAQVYTDGGTTPATEANIATAGQGIQIVDPNNNAKIITVSGVKTASTLESTLTGGAGDTILVREDDSTANSALLFIDEANVNGADMRKFIEHIDSAIGKMNEYTNQIGIDQRSLSNKEVNLSEAITSNSAARSRIMDTDFAKEQSNSIRLQILQQTATAALSQANMGPQAVLSFLG